MKLFHSYVNMNPSITWLTPLLGSLWSLLIIFKLGNHGGFYGNDNCPASLLRSWRKRAIIPKLFPQYEGLHHKNPLKLKVSSLKWSLINFTSNVLFFSAKNGKWVSMHLLDLLEKVKRTKVGLKGPKLVDFLSFFSPRKMSPNNHPNFSGHQNPHSTMPPPTCFNDRSDVAEFRYYHHFIWQLNFGLIQPKKPPSILAPFTHPPL